MLDQSGSPIQNALVQFFSPSATLLVQRITTSDGSCTFNVIFVSANASLFDDTFSCFASYGAYNNTVPCIIASKLPVVVILDLSGPPSPELPENPNDEETGTVDDATEFTMNLDQIWKILFEFVKIMSVLIIMWFFIHSNNFVVRDVFPHSLSNMLSIFKIVNSNWGNGIID